MLSKALFRLFRTAVIFVDVFQVVGILLNAVFALSRRVLDNLHSSSVVLFNVEFLADITDSYESFLFLFSSVIHNISSASYIKLSASIICFFVSV